LFIFKFICKRRMQDGANHVLGFRSGEAMLRQSFP
jgi:hypothetical protein